MPSQHSTQRESTARPSREGVLARAPLLCVIAALSLSAVGLVLLPPERVSSKPKAADGSAERAPEARSERTETTEPGATAPAGPPTFVEPAPVRAPREVEPAPVLAATGPRAGAAANLLLDVAERREAEDEERAEAADQLRADRPSSPQLLESPVEEEAMNALAAERAVERDRWLEEEKARPPRAKQPRAQEADSESQFDPK